MRAMTRDDIEAALAIEQAVQPYPWTRGNFGDALGSGYLGLVSEASAEAGGGLQGFVVLMPGVGEAELLNIAVAAGQQRKGVGRALLESALALSRERGWGRVFLEVRTGNLPAIALYRSAGFAEIGIRRGYYHNAAGSEDALIMACELSAGESNG
ncbi:MAG: ribosomal protein S18-alanine N-acetyltransferase [Gallionella sp.]|nr:ribosomal protein S18-alanine N-acetyltransferase [Gallionella sp.]MDD4946694.1 ribosomal protein S18-alanine N-acetyltransferase [Gallionella sp.]MDD5612531.1 ribosomal protein S18-alanine N-acetyltransferase [Gallionella sp.]